MNVSDVVKGIIQPYTKYLWLNKDIYIRNKEDIDKLLKNEDFIYDYMTEKRIYFKRKCYK